MAIRDLSPSSWNAPSTGRFAIAVQHSADDNDPIPLDVWISNYSSVEDEVADLNSGFNAVSIDSTYGRIVIIIPPFGNTTTITLKGPTGDTGIAVNPQGPIVLSIPSASPFSTVGLTCGAAISGVRIIVI